MVGGVLILLAFLAFCVLLLGIGSRLLSRRSRTISGQVLEPEAAGSSREPQIQADDRAESDRKPIAPAHPPRRPGGIRVGSLRWVSAGMPVKVAGRLIDAAMIYLTDDWRTAAEPSAIDRALPVEFGAMEAPPIGYWPKYGTLDPVNRGRYVEWLATGRTGPADLGLLFVFFYGLERRLLVDDAPATERAAIFSELERLRELYGNGNAFGRYADELVDVVRARDIMNRAASYSPDLSTIDGRRTLALRAAIGVRVSRREPVDFELAAAALTAFVRTDPAIFHRVTQYARTLFMARLSAAFHREHPAGLILPDNPDSEMAIQYQAGSPMLGSFRVATSADLHVPDPVDLDWSPLTRIAVPIARDLTSYVHLLRPDSGRSECLAVLGAFPEDLRDAVAVDAQRWLRSLPEPVAEVRYGTLARHAIGVDEHEVAPRHHAHIAEALARLDWRMAPDPTDGPARLAPDVGVFVYRNRSRSRSSTLDAALLAASLLQPIMVEADHDRTRHEASWLRALSSRFGLDADEHASVQAHLEWERTHPVTSHRMKKRIDAAGEPMRYDAGAMLAACAASMTGIESKALAAFERAFDRLGLPRTILYDAVHSATMPNHAPAEAPVPIIDGTAEREYAIPPRPASPGEADAPLVYQDDHRIPEPGGGRKAVLDGEDGSPAMKTSSSPPGGFDPAKLERIRLETEKAAKILREAEEEFDEAPILPAASHPPSAVEHGYPGLDDAHARLLGRLVQRADWSPDEIEVLARKEGLMSVGAIETINDWALDRWDEMILEEGDDEASMVVKLALLDPDGDK